MGLAQSFDSTNQSPLFPTGAEAVTNPTDQPVETNVAVEPEQEQPSSSYSSSSFATNEITNMVQQQQPSDQQEEAGQQACSNHGSSAQESSPVMNDATGTENDRVSSTAVAAAIAEDTDTPQDDDYEDGDEEDDEEEEGERGGEGLRIRRRGRRMIRGSGSMDDPSLIVSDDDFDEEHYKSQDDFDENQDDNLAVSAHGSNGRSGNRSEGSSSSPFVVSSPYAMDRTATLLMDTRATSGARPHVRATTTTNMTTHSLSPRRHGDGGHYSHSHSPPMMRVVDSPPSLASKKKLTSPSMTSSMKKTNSATKNFSNLPSAGSSPSPRMACINPASEINARLDTQVEVRVYPCNNSQSSKQKKYTQFTVKPEGVIIQGTNRSRTQANDLGSEYAMHVGRKLQRYELSDTRACQLLVTTHAKSFWVVPAPEAFSRHSGTCRLLGDKKHPVASHVLQVGDFLRVGSVGVVVIETHNGKENRVLSEDKIQSIMRDTTNSSGGFLDLMETDDGENSDDSMAQSKKQPTGDSPFCYMCFDDEDTLENPLISPCKCRGDTRYVHVNCLRKWHTAEADNQICFLSSVDATCSVCKTTFKSDFKLKDGRLVKLFKSSLEPPYVSLLVATKHEMAQRLFNTRFQLSFSSIIKADGKNATRPLLLGRSSGSDMVLDYRTVSARHATIRFKNGEFVFTDAGSSNGSYLYLRRPVELTPTQPVQFRLGRSMVSMKVVNKWNRRLLRAVRRSGNQLDATQRSDGDDASIGSNEEDVRINDGKDGTFIKYLPKRSRESIMQSLPPPGKLSQQSSKHLDLLHALAYPKKNVDGLLSRKVSSSVNRHFSPEAKTDEGSPENDGMSRQMAELSMVEND
mmetsp:Transcript_17288/g.32745  ORF Transcript_17288/g.32745 Transcript_17288/m.32745 type:complete len:857 (+) Transcript_17288:487-3057(+)|eukprot:CAMPEP_0176501438 /NCGR_PEP_ID=MMETSP0200_2-20121128/14160_1 /TAXON_ID=947934 /ORGANISM="Chaetoceros sp., Strain GSL56" /LENGTH=856 /DNA_ID=CAMNT_0017900323 /DNA_START=489 /DNA_END=3059 /DNA_ORIENTATION=+